LPAPGQDIVGGVAFQIRRPTDRRRWVCLSRRLL